MSDILYGPNLWLDGGKLADKLGSMGIGFIKGFGTPEHYKYAGNRWVRIQIIDGEPGVIVREPAKCA